MTVKNVVYLGNVPELAMALSSIQDVYLKSWILEKEDQHLIQKIAPECKVFCVEDYEQLREVILKQDAPDLGVMGNFGMPLKADILSIPKMGWWNLHFGLLPQYSGRYPVQAALEKKEKVIGITLHKATLAIDQGPMIRQASVLTGDHLSVDVVMPKLIGLACRMLQKELETIK